MSGTQIPTRRLYPVSEVAVLLGFCPAKTKNLIRDGEIRSLKIGRARRVPAEAIQEYIERLDAEQNGAA